MAFKEKYTNKYFVIDDDTESRREFYLEVFIRFGHYIKAIEANGIQNMNNDHWMIQMIRQHTTQIKMLTFDWCSFNGEINDILSQHMDITDLALRECWKDMLEYPAQLILPNHRKLKKFEHKSKDGGYYILSETVISMFQNNSALESLTLDFAELCHSEIFYENMLIIAYKIWNISRNWIIGLVLNWMNGHIRMNPWI